MPGEAAPHGPQAPPASDQVPRFLVSVADAVGVHFILPLLLTLSDARFPRTRPLGRSAAPLAQLRAPLLGKPRIFRISPLCSDILVISNILQLQTMIVSCIYISVLFRGVFLGKFLDAGLLGQRGREHVFWELPSSLPWGPSQLPGPVTRPASNCAVET